MAAPDSKRTPRSSSRDRAAICSGPPSQPDQIVIVKNHHLAGGAQQDVQLHAIGSIGVCPLERRERILRFQRAGTAVGYHQRQRRGIAPRPTRRAAAATTGPGAGDWGRGCAFAPGKYHGSATAPRWPRCRARGARARLFDSYAAGTASNYTSFMSPSISEGCHAAGGDLLACFVRPLAGSRARGTGAAGSRRPPAKSGASSSRMSSVEARLLFQALPVSSPERAPLRAKLMRYLLQPLSVLDANRLRQEARELGSTDIFDRLFESLRDACNLYEPKELWAQPTTIPAQERDLLGRAARLVLAVFAPRGAEAQSALALAVLVTIEPAATRSGKGKGAGMESPIRPVADLDRRSRFCLREWPASQHHRRGSPAVGDR